MHVPKVTLALMLNSNWKLYCFSNCSFETDTCETELELVSATGHRSNNHVSTVNLLLDSGSDDATDCFVPFDLTQGRKSPKMTFFEENNTTGMFIRFKFGI